MISDVVDTAKTDELTSLSQSRFQISRRGRNQFENTTGCETEAQRETLDEKTGGKNLVRSSLEIDTFARFRKQLFSELNHHNSALMCIGKCSWLQ
jgi:hypothetical protein